MIAHATFFYFFSIIAIFSAIMVVTSKNTVYSVFYLILDFISISCLFIMIGAEFLGMIMLIVYVGAVAVLFLFVVMMLNVSGTKDKQFKRKISYSHISFGSLISLIIFLELIIVVGGWKYKPNIVEVSSIIIDKDFTNTHAIGNVIYTDYIHLFQLAGLILLVSMIGAIVLTYRKREGIKKQSYFKQISREKKEAVTLVEVESNKGINLDD
ncbi:MAG TPA: NADH-quinone oxidoreductase subunit J [Pelagibacteraceae bacterium]|jgi:NADH-quinone oxidoreductase subunit J|nr:NADH-quinone oxidoreductase subunit J [Pelagibacteraceae bacterium]